MLDFFDSNGILSNPKIYGTFGEVDGTSMINPKESIIMAECPICRGEVEIEEDTLLGELVECPDCGTELEVTGVDPFTVDEASEVDDDEDEEEDEDEDEYRRDD